MIQAIGVTGGVLMFFFLRHLMSGPPGLAPEIEESSWPEREPRARGELIVMPRRNSA